MGSDKARAENADKAVKNAQTAMRKAFRAIEFLLNSDAPMGANAKQTLAEFADHCLMGCEMAAGAIGAIEFGGDK